MRRASKEEIRDKCINIENWIHRLKNLNEILLFDDEKIKFAVKRIRHDLEELEIMLGVED